MIWAEAIGGAIGRDGDMPWHLPEDLAHFKRVTIGAPVIMGRRTWDSLPGRFRPLPGRANLVVSRDPAYDAPGAAVVASLEEAVERAGAADARAWVMGGGQLYRAGMPLADELVVTRIDLEVPDADTFAPGIGPEWTLVDPGEPLESRSAIRYRFERWERVPVSV
ncbi:dihydrofolate reductase [Leucobacter zeae]|nr:dihydrofolate reductase [Leucobacter zeae]